MSVYMTEEEQLEVIKKWWQRYGNLVTVFISIIFLCIAGYKYWSWHEEKVMQQASSIYENMMIAFSNQKTKSVRSYANELIKDYGNSVYADVAHMTLAKLHISKNRLEQAKNELQLVINQGHVSTLREIAKIRVARILMASQSYDNALKELGAVDSPTYTPVVNELKGDIYRAKGQYQEAMEAYHLAMAEVKNNGIGNLFLEMKTNELTMKNQSLVNEGKKIHTT